MAELQKFVANLVQSKADADTESILAAIRAEFTSKKHGVDVNWRDFSDLYIMNVSNRSNLTDSFVRKCNGTIFDQNTHQIICYSFPVFLEGKDLPSVDTITPFKVESMYDGTLMKLFFHPSSGKWETATVKCFDASKSRWSSKKSFHDLFVETIGNNFNYSSLNPKKCYIGILIHPENKLVTDYYNCPEVEDRFKTPMFVHTGTCDLQTLTFDADYEKLPGDNIIKPQEFTFINMAEMNKYLEENVGQPIRPGFVYLDETTGERYKFMSPRYTEFKELRGNIQNMKYRILEMQGNDQIINKFLRSFPEYAPLNKEVQDDVADLAIDIFKHYSNYYFKHMKDKRMPPDIFEAVKAVNWKYKEDLEKVGGDRSRVPTNPDTIAYFLVTRYPFDKLSQMLGYHSNNNHVPKPQPQAYRPPVGRGKPTGRGPPRGRGKPTGRGPPGKAPAKAPAKMMQVRGVPPRNVTKRV